MMLYCLCMKPASVISHQNSRAVNNCRDCQHHLEEKEKKSVKSVSDHDGSLLRRQPEASTILFLTACSLSRQFQQVGPSTIVKLKITLLLQILVEKALIETVGLEWAGAEGSAGSGPAPAAASSHIAIRIFALLTQRMESDLAASRSTYSFSSPLQTGTVMAEV